MNKLIFSAIVILVLASCSVQKTEKDIELINIKEAGKEFYFAKIQGGKVNNKNEIQCSKYSYSRIYEDSIISYGNNLKSTISSIFNIDKKLVKVSKELDSTTFYSLKYIADKIDSSDMEFINQKLEEKLNINIEREKGKVKAYEIFIKNNKLLSYSKNDESNAYSSFRDNKITLENMNINGLTPYLCKSTNYFFFCNESNTLRVDMELKVSKDLNNLKKELAKNGLSIKESEIEKEFIFIE